MATPSHRKLAEKPPNTIQAALSTSRHLFCPKVTEEMDYSES
jgi:hypothetical protein